MLLPLLLILAGISAAGAAIIATADWDTVPDHPPDVPVGTPGSTGWKRVDAILPELKKASASSGYPLGLLVAWIGKESGGRLDEVTRLDERGYFQLIPDESRALGLDHQRLSVDPVYSINAGLLLIGRYAKEADALALFPRGSSAYWRLVKLGHTVGSGDTRKLVDAAKAAGAGSSWEAFEQFALSGAAHTKHSPAKWFPFLAALYRAGQPFGFGSESGQTLVGAGGVFDDILDPLDALPRRVV